MGAAAKKPNATYADVLNAPANKVAETISGYLRLSPRPSPRHARASSRLGSRLGGPFDEGREGPGGWILLDEPELHLGLTSGNAGPDIVVPDLAGWRRQRLPTLPTTAFIALAPDWICEVLSPSTEALDRSDKMDIYAREAVGHAWLVDPMVRTLECYRLQDTVWARVGVWCDDATVRVEPFDAIELPLSVLWAD